MERRAEAKEDTPSPRRRRPLAVALASQVVAAGLAFGGAWVLSAGAGVTPPLVAILGVQGLVAAALGAGFGLAGWWVPLQILLPPAAALGVWLTVPPWVYLLAFLGLLLVYWNSAGEGVPLYLTNRPTRAALAGLLPDREGFAFIDLGSGIGGILFDLARRRPDGRFTGVETAPVPFALSRLRLLANRASNVGLARSDIWSRDLSPYDVVYAFLSPVPMSRLYRKVHAEMRPGTLFVSNSFTVPEAPPDEVIEVEDRRRTRLHLWRM